MEKMAKTTDKQTTKQASSKKTKQAKPDLWACQFCGLNLKHR